MDANEKKDETHQPQQPTVVDGFFPRSELKPVEKKRGEEFYSVSAWDWVKNNPLPRVTRHLNRQVMCGACGFQCCHSELFINELSEEEAKRMELPTSFPQNGHCQCLTDQGCKFGDDRPGLCKVFPVRIDHETNVLNTPHWVLLHCPSPKDFEFVEMRGEKYVYRVKPSVRGFKKNKNIQHEICIDFPIEQWPNILESCSNGLSLMYGPEAVDHFRQALKNLNGETGFDLEAPNAT